MSSVLDMQVYALLGRLGGEREEACRKLRDAAREQADETLREARQRARARVRAAVREKRERVAEHCRRVRVDLETKRRDHDFGCLSGALEAGVARLPRVLAQRWTDPAARARWCAAVITGAGPLLGRGRWEIEHAPGLGADELERLAAQAAALAGEACVLREEPALGTGLRIYRGGACYDATTAGLTAQRARLESALLAEIAAAGAGRNGS